MGARKDITDLLQKVRRVTKYLNAVFGAELDLTSYLQEIFIDKRLKILCCQEGGEIGAVPVVLPCCGWPNATKAGHKASLSNHPLPVVQDGNLDFEVSKL
ncbi:hypothetical protein CO669_20990 [Bradyrhizobium sp. Y36]|nr:hypothetical protein CO669_20990 [Bradyrhizobium sp. Y36]